jgi:ribosomal protein L7/L12
VITWLSQFVQVASTETDKVDFTCDRKAPVQDEDTKILSLARSGDKMAAIKLARELYGCSLTEAVEFVEKLQSEK